MAAYAELSREEFNLFNPPFLAFVQHRSIYGFGERSAEGMSIPLAFTTATLAVFGHLREALPRTARTHVAKWLSDNPGLPPEIVRLVRGYAPALRRGFMLGLQQGMFQVEDGSLSATKLVRRPASLTDETVAAIDAARFAGRWFGGAGSQSTSLSLLGFSS
jgi:hypothetical protein